MDSDTDAFQAWENDNTLYTFQDLSVVLTPSGINMDIGSAFLFIDHQALLNDFARILRERSGTLHPLDDANTIPASQPATPVNGCDIVTSGPDYGNSTVILSATEVKKLTFAFTLLWPRYQTYLENLERD